MLQEVKVAHKSSSKKMGNEDRRVYFTSSGLILWSSNQTVACAGVPNSVATQSGIGEKPGRTRCHRSAAGEPE